MKPVAESISSGRGATTGAEARMYIDALRGAEAPLFHVTACVLPSSYLDRSVLNAHLAEIPDTG
jgi:hypothetical protein